MQSKRVQVDTTTLQTFEFHRNSLMASSLLSLVFFYFYYNFVITKNTPTFLHEMTNKTKRFRWIYLENGSIQSCVDVNHWPWLVGNSWEAKVWFWWIFFSFLNRIQHIFFSVLFNIVHVWMLFNMTMKFV